MIKRISKKYSFPFVAIIAIFVCLAIWYLGMIITHYYALNHFEVEENLGDRRAILGDSFGAVNALISAFAFAGVIVSMYLQRKDLQMQRESISLQQQELERNTKELALQRAEFESQNKTLMLQRFENTLFGMLNLQQEIVTGLHYEYVNFSKVKESRSRDVFDVAYNAKTVYDDDDDDYISFRELIGDNFNEYENTYHQQTFDHYFRHLYQIIKFIDEASILSDEEKYSYTSMVRATLSSYELVWLFYNALSHNGREKFKPLIEHYALLKNLRKELLANTNYCGDYRTGAYRRQTT